MWKIIQEDDVQRPRIRHPGESERIILKAVEQRKIHVDRHDYEQPSQSRVTIIDPSGLNRGDSEPPFRVGRREVLRAVAVRARAASEVSARPIGSA
jgi:hypothetical protein